MTTEHLKANIIDCFKENETELLLCCLMADTEADYINIAFDYKKALITALYSNKKRRFILLKLGEIEIKLTNLP